VARGRGVIIMALDEGEKLAAVAVTANRTVTVIGIAPRSGKEKELVLADKKFEHHVGHRARTGRVLPEKLKAPLALRVDATPEATK